MWRQDLANEKNATVRFERRQELIMQSLSLAGSCGSLEARFHRNRSEDAPVVLVLHPNPKQGGTMNTLVVYSLFTVFQDLGFSALRINFRGVGKSDGVSSGGPGELEDARAAWAWLRSECRGAKAAWIAGFSFGAWVGLKLLTLEGDVDGFVAVAPPVNNLDFSFHDKWVVSSLVAHGTADALVPEKNVLEFVAKPRAPGVEVEYAAVPGAGHFFDPGQEELARLVGRYVSRRIR